MRISLLSRALLLLIPTHERVSGVAEAKADSTAKRADVTYDPDKVSPAELAAALTKGGYPATVHAQ
jgi:copper chaperone CopZ